MMLAPSPGFVTLEFEFEVRLCRAFSSEERPDFIYYDSYRQRFLMEGIAYGVARGWLTSELNEIEEQYARYEARLTPAGRERFGLALLSESLR